MNDAYYEQLVSRKSRLIDWVIRFITILVLVALLVFGFPFFGFFSIPVILILGALAFYFVFPKLNVEFEYTILNHDLQIDIIYNKSKRKNLLSVDIKDAEIMAPKDSSELHSYKTDKVFNYTSGNANAAVYALIIPIKQYKARILLEPNESMLNHMKNWMGTKFHME